MLGTIAPPTRAVFRLQAELVTRLHVEGVDRRIVA